MDSRLFEIGRGWVSCLFIWMYETEGEGFVATGVQLRADGSRKIEIIDLLLARY